MSKYIQKGLILLLLLLGIILPSNNAKAEDLNEPDWIGQAGQDPKLQEDGTLVYVTLDKTATSLIRYGTRGFTVKPYESKPGEGSSAPNPTGGGKDILYYNKNTTKEPYVSDLKTYTKYTFRAKDVMEAFDAAGVTEKTLSKTGGYVYFAIIQGYTPSVFTILCII